MRGITQGSHHELFHVRRLFSYRPKLTRDSTLKEMFVDVCVDSSLDESDIDKGVNWKTLAQRIGTTSLEAGIIATYQQRLTDAKSGLMVSRLYVDSVIC